MIDTNFVILLFFVYVLSLFGTIYYRKFALRHHILANLNFRTLHENPTPRGGGIVFSMVFVFFVFCLYFINLVELELMLVFGIGAGLATTVGYIDDLKGIGTIKKLILQFLLVLLILYVFNGGPLSMIEQLSGWLSWTISAFLLLWLINVYNFIDGIDGLAISGAILILITLLLTFYITNHTSNIVPLFLVLFASCFGFLFFNWPKASIFMGDSGSIFLGYCFGAFIVYSLMNDEISFLTWLVVFGYYLGDTTTTTLIRIMLVKKWYHPHRSHAYQNLARKLDNHAIVSFGVMVYHILWLLPLAIWTVLKPNFGIIAVVLAFLPSIIWSIKFGPLFSRE